LEVVRPDALQRRQRAHEHVIRTLEVARFLDRRHVLRLLDDADDGRVAAVAGAEGAGIDVCNVVADRAVRHALFHVAQRVDQTLRLLARRPQDVKRETLCTLRSDAGQALQFLDETDQRIWQGHYIPGSFMPGGSMPPIFCAISSSALRWASLIAATMRSCSISISSFETTSGSIFSDCTCLAPLITSFTMPPPASP